MCGRFTIHSPGEVLQETFDLDEEPVELEPRYNAAPTDELPTIRLRRPSGSRPPSAGEGGDRPEDAAAAGAADPAASGAALVRRLGLMRWGLVPSWAKDLAIGARQINARAESLDVRPAFADSLRKRRCLVPADGFFEWRAKQPFLVRRADAVPFAMAGLWAAWRPRGVAADGQPPPWVRSFAIVTVAANTTLAPLHDRMPAILPSELWDAWLDPDLDETEALLPLLRPAPDELLIAVPVDRRVGNVRNDDPSCIAPLTDRPATDGDPAPRRRSRKGTAPVQLSLLP